MTKTNGSTYISPLCALLRRRREELKMTQAELAEQLGVVSEAVGQWERAGRRMELDRLPRIATALKIDVKPLCLLALSEFHPSFHAALCDGNEKEFHS